MIHKESNCTNFSTLLALTLVILGIAIVAPAQTFDILVNFDNVDGANPNMMDLVQGTDGSLYGTTDWGGGSGLGTVFKLAPNGLLTTMYSFCQRAHCTDGANPVAGLALGADGNFYGTTIGGGQGLGTIFRITPSGVLTTLHRFGGVEGALPVAALVLATDGNFYGTTSEGGSSVSCLGVTSGCGSVFKITPKGAYTLLHSFDLTDGADPQAGLIQASDGNLYGTAFQGGKRGFGTVFKITMSGSFTNLHSFNGNDGENPSSVLIETTGGVFEGTAGFGGANGYGTIFQITSGGRLTTLHNFDLTDGYVPSGVLVPAGNGDIYGITESGGSQGALGTVFRMTADGTLMTVHSFCLQSQCADGANPTGGLLLATDGNLYGATYAGGTHLRGTIFRLGIGLEPFVK